MFTFGTAGRRKSRGQPANTGSPGNWLLNVCVCLVL